MNADEKYNRLCPKLLLFNNNKIARLNPNEKNIYKILDFVIWKFVLGKLILLRYTELCHVLDI